MQLGEQLMQPHTAASRSGTVCTAPGIAADTRHTAADTAAAHKLGQGLPVGQLGLPVGQLRPPAGQLRLPAGGIPVAWEMLEAGQPVEQVVELVVRSWSWVGRPVVAMVGRCCNCPVVLH